MLASLLYHVLPESSWGASCGSSSPVWLQLTPVTPSGIPRLAAESGLAERASEQPNSLEGPVVGADLFLQDRLSTGSGQCQAPFPAPH